MADIFVFPARMQGEESVRSATSSTSDRSSERPDGLPDDFWNAVCSIRRMQRLRGVMYQEIPAPVSAADHGISVALDVVENGDSPRYAASGWVTVLYAADRRFRKGSKWYCMAFASIPKEGHDRKMLTPATCWKMMRKHITHVADDEPAGTVTLTSNTPFGDFSARPHDGCEIRVSWTPLNYAEEDGEECDAGAQVAAWASFLKSTVNCEEDRPVE